MTATNLSQEFSTQNHPSVLSDYYYDRARIVYAYLKDNPKKIINLLKQDSEGLFFDLIDPANLLKRRIEFETQYCGFITKIFNFFERDIRKELEKYKSTVSNDKLYISID